MHEFASTAAGRLGRMVGIYKAMVPALLNEDLESLSRLKKKARSIKRDIEVVRENEVLPALAGIPKELADRGQLIFRITEISANTADRLFTIVKAAFNHIDNFHDGLEEEQGKVKDTITHAAFISVALHEMAGDAITEIIAQLVTAGNLLL